MIIKGSTAVKWIVESNRREENWVYYTSTLAEAVAVGIEQTREYIYKHEKTERDFTIDEVLEILGFGECDIEKDVIVNSDGWTGNDYITIRKIGVDF